MAKTAATPSDPHAFDAKMARALERDYQTPEIVEQRRRTLDALALNPGERALDAGCGPGLLTAAMADAVGADGHVLGIDRSADMLALARARCGDRPNVTIANGDIGALPVDNGTLDALACAQLLLLIDDVAGALREFQRALRPAGRLIVVETDWRSAVINSDHRDLSHRLFEAWDAMAANPNLPARIAPLLRAAGFSVAAPEAVPVINTDYGPGAFSYNYVRGLARQAAEQGMVTEAEAETWLTDLKRKGQDGAYFFSVNRYIFTAAKT